MSINKELNLLKKSVYSITKFTTTDYKDHLSCIVWFNSCNMRCQYCYNPDIVLAKEGNLSIEEVYTFLKKRVGLLDAVVLSGGEATNHDLFDLCKTIKSLGYKIKLDTNGSNPKLLKTLLENNLLNYVALDFKATKKKFKQITKSSFYDEFLLSLKLMINSSIDYEVRTTLHADLLDEEDINQMQKILKDNGYKKDFYVQNFLEVSNLSNLEKPVKRFDKNRLKNILNIVWRD